MTTMTTMTPTASAKEGRARLIKLIHVARRELERAGRLDEPGYRGMLRAVSDGRHESAADLSYTQLKAALARLSAAGFQVRRGTGSRPLAVNPEASKARALWLFLHGLGVVRDPSEQALAAYVKSIAKVDDLRWARGDRTALVIETLKKWAMRYLPAVVADLKQELVDLSYARPLSVAQAELGNAAQFHLSKGQGFDKHWAAWECLMKALERPVAAELAALRNIAAKEARR